MYFHLFCVYQSRHYFSELKNKVINKYGQKGCNNQKMTDGRLSTFFNEKR